MNISLDYEKNKLKKTKKIIIISLIGFGIVFSALYIPYLIKINADLAEQEKLYANMNEFLSKVTKFSTDDPHCYNDLDYAKSGIANGTYAPLGCFASYTMKFFFGTTNEELIQECRNWYDERVVIAENKNNQKCQELGIAECSAYVMIKWDDFQKKFCDWNLE